MDISAELQLHRIDVVQSGATAKGTLRVSQSLLLRLVADQYTDQSQRLIGLAARSEQAAEGCIWRLSRRPAMRVCEERRDNHSLQDASHRTQGLLCHTWQGLSQPTGQDICCTWTNGVHTELMTC